MPWPFREAVLAFGPTAGAANGRAVALLTQSQTVICFGDKRYGGATYNGKHTVQDVVHLVASTGGFAVLRATRNVDSWGIFSSDSLPTEVTTGNQVSRRVRLTSSQ